MTDATTTTAPRRDGRNIRSDRTRALIITTTRALMLGGDFRPSVTTIARNAPCSVRSVFQHFGDLEGVHREAIADVRTRDNIVGLIKPTGPMPEPLLTDCIVHAAVFGRPIPPKPEAAIAAE